MKGICRLCGCTETTTCMTAEGPCDWADGHGETLCTACCVREGMDLIPKDCYHCGNLKQELFYQEGNLATFTCLSGRFDGKEIKPPYHQWFSWSAIALPWKNKTVAKAQFKCPSWKLREAQH